MEGVSKQERILNSFVQAAIDQLLETETLDLIVDSLANGDFCATLGIGTLLIPENIYRWIPKLSTRSAANRRELPRCCGRCHQTRTSPFGDHGRP